MPSVNSSSVIAVWDSSTVMTPSLPTLSNASAIRPPMIGSCADSAATWAISSLPSTSRAASSRRALTASTAASMPRLSQHGRGGRTVTGHVVGLGGDLLGELRAEVLVGVLELHLTGDRHAVVGDGRGAPLLVNNNVATLWAERHLDGVGELVHATLERLARRVIEFQRLGHEPSLTTIGSWGCCLGNCQRQRVGIRTGMPSSKD